MNNFVQQCTELHFLAEAARLEAEARVLLACGYAIDELISVQYPDLHRQIQPKPKDNP